MPLSISIPASLAIGVPVVKMPHWSSYGAAPPTTASMNSRWFTAFSATRRIAALSNGGNRKLNRRNPISPFVSTTFTVIVRSVRSDGTRSISGCST